MRSVPLTLGLLVLLPAPASFASPTAVPIKPSVRWYTNFPNRGPGLYRVTWKLGSRSLGPALRFRLP